MTREGVSNLLVALAVAGACVAQAACTSQQPGSESAAGTTGDAAAVATTPDAAPAGPEAKAAAPSQSAASRTQARPEAARPAAATAAAPAPPAAKPEPPPPPPPPRTFTLTADSALSVYITSALSTAVNKTGEPFAGTLAEPIVDGDWTIARRGARVTGVIVDSDPGGKVKGVASITLALNELTLADGRTIEIATGAVTEQANTSKGKDAKKVGIGAGIGAAIGAIAGGGSGAAIGAAVGGGAGTAAALATRGNPATVPSESLVRFVLESPVTITQIRRP